MYLRWRPGVSPQTSGDEDEFGGAQPQPAAQARATTTGTAEYKAAFSVIVDDGTACTEPCVLMLREERAGIAQPRLALPGGKRIASDAGRAEATAAREMREELGEALAVCVSQGTVPAGVGVWEQHTRAVVRTLRVVAQASAAVHARTRQWVPQA